MSPAMIFQDLIFLGLGAIVLFAMHGGGHPHEEEVDTDPAAWDAALVAAEASEEEGHVNYTAIWGGLTVLTLLELGVPEVFGKGYSLPILLLTFLAVLKAWLVAYYFMHLKTEESVIWRILGLMIICLALGTIPYFWDIIEVYGTY